MPTYQIKIRLVDQESAFQEERDLTVEANNAIQAKAIIQEQYGNDAFISVVRVAGPAQATTQVPMTSHG